MIKLTLHLVLLSLIIISCTDNKNEHLIGDGNHKSIKEFPSPEFFYFAGATELNPGVYKFNFEKKKSTLIWNSRTEKVIDLIASDDFEKVFFITAVGYGMAGSFPYINKARLYRIDPVTHKAEYLTTIGDVIQIYSYWSEEGNFNLFINSFDPRVNTYVIQNKQLYNQFGRILTDESETFDLLISGYPKFKFKEAKFNSYNGKFRLLNVADSIFVRSQKDKQRIFLQETDHRINDVEWISERSLLIYSTIIKENRKQTEVATLNIYNTETKEMLKNFTGLSLFRFAITNDFLIFDSGFGRNSKIYILNLNDLSEFFKINIAGGCGLRNIPENPFLGN